MADVKEVALSIFELIHQTPKGVTQQTLNQLNVPLEQMKEAINLLLTDGRLKIFKEGNEIMYREANVDDVSKFRGLSAEEMLVFQLVEEKGNVGIWIRDLRYRSSLQTTQLNKILKMLESRKLIKSVKSIAGKNKKVYMKYDIEPSKDITGGAWYNELSEFESDFIEELSKSCYQFILQKGHASADEIENYVRNSGISRIELRLDDVQMIIDSLIYDGKIEEFRDPRDRDVASSFLSGRRPVLFKPARIAIPRNGLTTTPCGLCPVAKECSDVGDVTPTKCIYLANWLDF